MKYIIILFALIFAACSKDECQTCKLVTESNVYEAQLKCDGLANNYPAFETLSSENLGCLDSTERTQAKKGESTVNKTECSGVTSTVRVRVVCN